MIYLDSAATTAVHPDVIKVITEALTTHYGNPSSTYQLGRTAHELLESSRQTIARCLNVSSDEIYFTSGATEAINWAIRSQAYQSRELALGNHLVATSIEHSAVLKCLEQLEDEGFTYTLVNPNSEGEFTVDQFEAVSTPQTTGWIAMAVNNEVGSILPIESISKAAQSRGYWFHCDTVQAIGKVDCDYASYPITSFVVTGHKISGPKGVGILVYRPQNPAMQLHPMIVGGGQERSQRAGTENIPYIAGLAKAIELATGELTQHLAHYQSIKDDLLTSLKAHQIEYHLNGDTTHSVDNIVNLWLPDFESAKLRIQMDLVGIAVSAGSACSAGSIQPSRILKAYYPNETDRLVQSLRISFSPETTKNEIDQFVKTLVELKEKGDK